MLGTALGTSIFCWLSVEVNFTMQHISIAESINRPDFNPVFFPIFQIVYLIAQVWPKSDISFLLIYFSYYVVGQLKYLHGLNIDSNHQYSVINYWKRYVCCWSYSLSLLTQVTDLSLFCCQPILFLNVVMFIFSCSRSPNWLTLGPSFTSQSIPCVSSAASTILTTRPYSFPSLYPNAGDTH